MNIEKEDLTRPQVINSLLNIGHGDLTIYSDLGLQFVKLDPGFFAHLVPWNHNSGKVRDSKNALPVIGLRGETNDKYFENAAAHLCLLDPRNLLKAIRFHKSLPPTHNGAGKYLKKAVNLYLKMREGNNKWFDKTALQHRRSLKELYALFHINMGKRARSILHGKERSRLRGRYVSLDLPKNSIFSAISEIKNMKPQEAAGTIMHYDIPFLTAMGALGGINKNMIYFLL